LRVVAFGQTATAQLYVMSDAVRIEVQLPWILAALTGKIQGVLKTKAEKSTTKWRRRDFHDGRGRNRACNRLCHESL
jgi:hypothetical protein